MARKKRDAYRSLIKSRLINLYGNKCYYCNETLSYNKLTFDHIYPKSKYLKNGNVTVSNCVLACQPCNIEKGDNVIPIEEFRKFKMGNKYFKFKSPHKPKIHEPESKENTEYARNVKYPENPIVKRQMTMERFIEDLVNYTTKKINIVLYNSLALKI